MRPNPPTESTRARRSRRSPRIAPRPDVARSGKQRALGTRHHDVRGALPVQLLHRRHERLLVLPRDPPRVAQLLVADLREEHPALERGVEQGAGQVDHDLGAACGQVRGQGPIDGCGQHVPIRRTGEHDDVRPHAVRAYRGAHVVHVMPRQCQRRGPGEPLPHTVPPVIDVTTVPRFDLDRAQLDSQLLEERREHLTGLAPERHHQQHGDVQHDQHPADPAALPARVQMHLVALALLHSHREQRRGLEHDDTSHAPAIPGALSVEHAGRLVRDPPGIPPRVEGR